jgi:hypothetical protein
MTTFSGTIVGYNSIMGSGLATLFVAERRGRVTAIPCDAGPSSRALRSAFGDRVIGQEISFVVDELGILSSFTPIGEV